MLPRVAVIATGGTIDAVGSSRLDLANYIAHDKRLSASALVESIASELVNVATVSVLTPFARKPGHALSDEDEAELVEVVKKNKDGYDGFVVTHGTNTIEETAFLLHLLVDTAKVGVVVTGAMRPSSALSADGPLNLLNAVRVASSPLARGAGVLVAMDDTVHGARHVTKSSTSACSAFQSRGTGPLGRVDGDGRVVFYRGGRFVPPFDENVGSLKSLPRVDVVVSYLGQDSTAIDACVEKGARGIVSAGTGAGYPTPEEEEGLIRAAAKGVVVCQSSRVGDGCVVRTPHMVRLGFVSADNLQPWKARILLRLALAQKMTVDQIQNLFDTV